MVKILSEVWYNSRTRRENLGLGYTVGRATYAGEGDKIGKIFIEYVSKWCDGSICSFCQ